MRIAILSASALLLTACSSGPAEVVNSELQHHHWTLSAIDGVAISSDIKSDLEVAEHLTINGLAGCNRFFGSASIEKNRLIAEPLATTMMACSPAEQVVEQAVLETLGKGATINNQGTELTLTGDKHTLTYTLADWM
ncbi:META domain-containing protein [Oceanisphaera sp. W20_SRM_FM3]|uniref:META domain-containing protein n=1 Tax=Oceanisphaera sp. W20_SRM_FM3 TaxID=3240267 RepID=UPI003F9BAFD6